MIYRKVKMIEEEISIIGLGCWNFGGDWDGFDEKNSIYLVDKAIDLGINLFDIAPVYGFGNAERVLGKALKNGKRNKVLIASKCGLRWDDNKNTYNNLTKESIMWEIDQSLKRLNTDYIDIYQLHWPDHNTPLEETVAALEELKKAGKIRYVGLANFSVSDVEKIMSYIDVHSQQSLYNMLERNTDSYHNIELEYRTEEEILPIVKRNGQAFFPYSPLFQGLLTDKFIKGEKFSELDIRNQNPKLVGETFNKYYSVVEKLYRLSKDIGKKINEIALNWLMSKDEVTSIIGGASSIRQLESNIKSTEWKLSEEELQKIEEIIDPFKYI